MKIENKNSAVCGNAEEITINQIKWIFIFEKIMLFRSIFFRFFPNFFRANFSFSIVFFYWWNFPRCVEWKSIYTISNGFLGNYCIFRRFLRDFQGFGQLADWVICWAFWRAFFVDFEEKIMGEKLGMNFQNPRHHQVMPKSPQTKLIKMVSNSCAFKKLFDWQKFNKDMH
jgi:hypothetical protein